MGPAGGERTCTKCKKTKLTDDFPFSGGAGERSPWCRNCHHEMYTKKRDGDRQNVLSVDFGDFPERLRHDRKARGMTQVELGAKIGVTNVQVALWERGKSLPRQKNLVKVCEILGWDFPYELAEDYRIPLRIDNCASCGNPFPVLKEGVRHCSRKCAGKSQSLRQAAEGNHRWSGGRISSGGGYIKVLIPGHPKADGKGYILEHRYVMEQMIGRPLESYETVHHKNGQREDNRPENLELWKGSQPAGVRAADYHCAGCRCHAINMEWLNVFDLPSEIAL